MIRRLIICTLFLPAAVMLTGCREKSKDETSMLKAVGDKVREIKEANHAQSKPASSATEEWFNSLTPEGAGSPITIAEDGKSSHSIVIGQEATTQDNKAASELQRWLKDMTGAELPIMYVKLMQGPEITGVKYGELIDRFEKIARRVGVTRLREGPPDLDEKLRDWRRRWSNYKNKTKS